MVLVKIHTVFITHNRLDLTKQAIFSYLETVTGPHSYCVVDNASTDETQRWLLNTITSCHLLKVNRYPGYATNLGWRHAPEDATHLHRADNDFIFLPDWCEEVERCFSENAKLGQLGMRTDEQELFNDHNVGGNCVISREIWDAGLRYKEKPWPQIRTVGFTEDSFMSPEVVKMGYEWSRVKRLCIEPLPEDFDDPYYQQTYRDRGLIPPNDR